MRALIIAASLLLALNVTAQAGSRTLTIATGDYAPFTGANLPNHGVVNHQITQIVETAGFDIEYKYLPWKRTLEETRRGNYVATSYWNYSTDREADFIHVGPVMQAHEVFYARRDSNIPNWTRLEDLAGLRIGVVPGYTYSPELWELGRTGVLTLVEATSDEANLRKLLAGRIDLFPIEKVVGQHIIANTFDTEDQERFMPLPQPLAISNGYLLVSRAHEDAEAIALSLQRAADEMDDGMRP